MKQVPDNEKNDKDVEIELDITGGKHYVNVKQLI